MAQLCYVKQLNRQQEKITFRLHDNLNWDFKLTSVGLNQVIAPEHEPIIKATYLGILQEIYERGRSKLGLPPADNEWVLWEDYVSKIKFIYSESENKVYEVPNFSSLSTQIGTVINFGQEQLQIQEVLNNGSDLSLLACLDEVKSWDDLRNVGALLCVRIFNVKWKGIMEYLVTYREVKNWAGWYWPGKFDNRARGLNVFLNEKSHSLDKPVIPHSVFAERPLLLPSPRTLIDLREIKPSEPNDVSYCILNEPEIIDEGEMTILGPKKLIDARIIDNQEWRQGLSMYPSEYCTWKYQARLIEESRTREQKLRQATVTSFNLSYAPVYTQMILGAEQNFTENVAHVVPLLSTSSISTTEEASQKSVTQRALIFISMLLVLVLLTLTLTSGLKKYLENKNRTEGSVV